MSPQGDDPLGQSVAKVEEMVRSEHPDARFRLESGGHEGIYHLSIYSADGRIRLPLGVTEFLNQVWREHKITLITTVYDMEHYPGE